MYWADKHKTEAHHRTRTTQNRPRPDHWHGRRRLPEPRPLHPRFHPIQANARQFPAEICPAPKAPL